MNWMELFKILPPYGALALVFATWHKQHKDASERDIKNWRRTTIAETVGSIVADAETMVSRDFSSTDNAERRAFYEKVWSLDRHQAILDSVDIHLGKHAQRYIKAGIDYANELARKAPTDEQNADRKKKGNLFIAERATLLTERSKSIGISPWGELDKT